MKRIIKDKILINVFRSYRQRYIDSGKRPDAKKFLADDLYHTMRLEGEKITKKEAQALFR